MRPVSGLSRADLGRGQTTRSIAADNRGFTLVEILVALAILAMVFGSALEVFSRGTSAMSAGESYSRAATLARSTLDEFGVGQLEPGSHQGTYPQTDPPMRWQVDIEPYPGDALGEHEHSTLTLFSLRVVVEWRDVVRSRSVTLTSLALSQPKSRARR